MATQQELFVNKALSYKGYNCSRFIYAMKPYGATYGDAWCAWFVSTIAKECGLTDIIPITGGAGCFPREGVPRGMGTWHEGHNSVPRKGDIIVFTWNGLGSYESSGQDKYFSDHVGIVVKVDNGYVHTVEGNANGTNTSSTVCEKSYPLYSGKINGYYRPNYKNGDDEMNFKKGDKSDGVLAYKSLIRTANELGIVKAKVDASNSFGDGTYKATIEIQKKYKLEVDGIAGPKTIAALFSGILSAITSLKSSKSDRNTVLAEAVAAINKLKA